MHGSVRGAPTGSRGRRCFARSARIGRIGRAWIGKATRQVVYSRNGGAVCVRGFHWSTCGLGERRTQLGPPASFSPGTISYSNTSTRGANSQTRRDSLIIRTQDHEGHAVRPPTHLAQVLLLVPRRRQDFTEQSAPLETQECSFPLWFGSRYLSLPQCVHSHDRHQCAALIASAERLP